jgi:hypothetical protein
MKAFKSQQFTFDGWDLRKYIKGRKRLVVALIGAVSTYYITQNPALAAIIGSATEMGFAILEYWTKE